MNAELSPRARSVGVVVWCSFLTACGATAVLFAFVDPDLLWHVESLTIYALGFFFFWAVAAVSAALASYMASTEH